MPCRNPNIVARNIMMPLKKLITLSPEMDSLDAMRMLLKHRISGAPVVDAENRYLGVFSEKTSMQFLLRLSYDDLPSSDVGSFMNTDRERTIQEETDLLSIVDMFILTPYRRLPVLSGEYLVGQISRRDAISAALKQLERPHAHPRKPLYLSAVGDTEEAVGRLSHFGI